MHIQFNKPLYSNMPEVFFLGREDYPGVADGDAVWSGVVVGVAVGVGVGVGVGVEVAEADGLGLGEGDGEAEGEGLGLMDGFGVALTAGLTEGLVDGEGEGEGLGLVSGVGLGEGELVSPKTSGFDGKKTDLNQNPEPIKITSKTPARERVSRDGFCLNIFKNYCFIIHIYTNQKSPAQTGLF